MVGYDFKSKPKYPKANADLRASTSLELHIIHKDDLQQIFNAYQKFESYFMDNFEPAFCICDEFEVRRCARTTLHLIVKCIRNSTWILFSGGSMIYDEHHYLHM